MGDPTPRERVAARLQAVQASALKAEEAGKWTAAASLNDSADKLMSRLIELEAMEAEAAEQEELDADPRTLVAEIVAAARDLPSYLLDDLVGELERLRECEEGA